MTVTAFGRAAGSLPPFICSSFLDLILIVLFPCSISSLNLFPYLPFLVTLELSVILAASLVTPRLDRFAALCSDQPPSSSQYRIINSSRYLVRRDVHLDHADEPSHLLLLPWIECT